APARIARTTTPPTVVTRAVEPLSSSSSEESEALVSSSEEADSAAEAASALAFVGFVVGSSPLPKLKAIVLPGSGSKAKTPLSAKAQELPSAVKKPQKASASGALAHEVSGTPSIAHSSFGSDW